MLQLLRTLFISKSNHPLCYFLFALWQLSVLSLLLIAPAVAAPTNDNFSSAQQLNGTQGSITGNNTDATQEIGEQQHDDKPGVATVWYKWTPNSSQAATIDTIGSSFDTVLAVYKSSNPARVNSLTAIVSDDDGGGGYTSRVRFTATANTTYYIAVAGYNRSVGNIVLKWAQAPVNDNLVGAFTISNTKGSVTGSNNAATLEEGENGNYSGASVWYKWIAPSTGNYWFDTIGSNFDTVLAIHKLEASPASFTTLTFIKYDDNSGANGTSGLNFDATAGTTYYIAIGGNSGPLEGNFTLNWVGTPPYNDSFAYAASMDGISGTVTSNNQNATGELFEPEHDGNVAARSVWYKWRSNSNQKVTFDTIGSKFDTVLAIYTASGTPAKFANLALVASDDDSGGGVVSKIRIAATESTDYYIAVDGVNGSNGELVLNWAVSPLNDDFLNAQYLPNYSASGTVTGTNIGATMEFEEPTHIANKPGGQSVWYWWTAPDNGKLTVSTGPTVNPSDFDTQLAVYSGNDVDALTLLSAGSNDDISTTNLNSRVTVNVVAGTTYSFAVDGKVTNGKTASGNINLEWSFVISPPANNNFQSAQQLSGPSGTVGGTTKAATKEAGEAKHNGENGGTSVWYKWTAPAAGNFAFKVTSNFIGPLLGIYKNGSVTPVAVNNVTKVTSTSGNSSLLLAATQNVVYYIAVDANYGEGYFELSWLALPANDNFNSATLISGASGSTTGNNVEATKENGENFGYYNSIWYKWKASGNGNFTFDAAGSDFKAVLTIYAAGTPNNFANLTSVASDPNAGSYGPSKLSFVATKDVTYYLAVENVYSGPGNLKLKWYAAPANDNFAAAQPLSGNSGSSSSYTNLGASKELNEPVHSGDATVDAGGKSVWFKWSTSVAGNDASFKIAGADFETVAAVYKGTSVDALTLVTADEDIDSDGTSSLIFAPEQNQVYYIAVDGRDGNDGPFSLNWTYTPGAAPANDLYASAKTLNGFSGKISGSNLNAKPNETGEKAHAGQTGGASIWYQWRAPATGTVSFDTFGATIDTLLAVYTGNSLANSLVVTSNDDYSPADKYSSLSFKASAGVLYHIALDGKGGAKGATALNWTQTVDAPTVSTFSPSSGEVGTKVVIQGVNLHLVTSIQLNGLELPFTLYSGKLTATIAANAVTGPLTVRSTTAGETTGTGIFTVTTPFSTEYSPTSGPAGTLVTIKGANFNSVTKVDFNGGDAGPKVTKASTTTPGFQIVSDNEISVRVPDAANYGPINLTSSGGVASTGYFTVLSRITSLSPTSGPAGTAVTIKGTACHAAIEVTFNNKVAKFFVNSANEIIAIVPPDATSGQVKFSSPYSISNTINFTVIPTTLSSFSPLSGPKATTVTIRGANFTTSSVVKFNGLTVAAPDVKFVNSSQLTANVPSLATTGPISVTTGSTTLSSTSNFTVLPTIDSFSPTSGAAGQLVTIKGSNLSGVTRVDFNGTSAAFAVRSATEIAATVPAAATTGLLKLTISGDAGNGSVNSASSFTVSPAVPSITGISPSSGPVGTVVTNSWCELYRGYRR